MLCKAVSEQHSRLVQPFFLQPNLFQLQNVGDVRNSGLEAEGRRSLHSDLIQCEGVRRHQPQRERIRNVR